MGAGVAAAANGRVKPEPPLSIQKRIEFAVLWLVVAAGVALVVWLLGWWVADKYGVYRGGLLLYGMITFLLFMTILHLNDDFEAGQGDFSVFRAYGTWILPSPLDWPGRVRAFLSFKRMDRPWFKALLLGAFVGAQVFGVTVLATARRGTPTIGALRGEPLRKVDLPLVSGGDFRTEDLAGRTSVVVVTASRGSDAFVKAWDESKSTTSNPLDLTVLVMDQYGDVAPYRKRSVKHLYRRYPTAVGRKWMREWFGHFEGNRLVFVVGPDTTVKAVFTHDEPIEVVIATILGEFADPSAP